MECAYGVNLRELNPHLVCALCGGYLIDAMTIQECIHSFCRSCIIRFLESSPCCPICDVQVHKSRPLRNIREDRVLQALVYKLVPGLYHREQERRRKHLEENPTSISSDEDSGSDDDSCDWRQSLSEHTVASLEYPLQVEEENISVCLQLCDTGPPYNNSSCTSSPQYGGRVVDTRYLLVPAPLPISLLEKFIRSKFQLSNDKQIDVYFSDEKLADKCRIMDVAYLCHWKRLEPLKLFYTVKETNHNSHKQLNHSLATQKHCETTTSSLRYPTKSKSKYDARKQLINYSHAKYVHEVFTNDNHTASQWRRDKCHLKPIASYSDRSDNDGRRNNVKNQSSSERNTQKEPQKLQMKRSKRLQNNKIYSEKYSKKNGRKTKRTKQNIHIKSSHITYSSTKNDYIKNESSKGNSLRKTNTKKKDSFSDKVSKPVKSNNKTPARGSHIKRGNRNGSRLRASKALQREKTRVNKGLSYCSTTTEQKRRLCRALNCSNIAPELRAKQASSKCDILEAMEPRKAKHLDSIVTELRGQQSNTDSLEQNTLKQRSSPATNNANKDTTSELYPDISESRTLQVISNEDKTDNSLRTNYPQYDRKIHSNEPQNKQVICSSKPSDSQMNSPNKVDVQTLKETQPFNAPQTTNEPSISSMNSYFVTSSTSVHSAVPSQQSLVTSTRQSSDDHTTKPKQQPVTSQFGNERNSTTKQDTVPVENVHIVSRSRQNIATTHFTVGDTMVSKQNPSTAVMESRKYSNPVSYDNLSNSKLTTSSHIQSQSSLVKESFWNDNNVSPNGHLQEQATLETNGDATDPDNGHIILDNGHASDTNPGSSDKDKELTRPGQTITNPDTEIISGSESNKYPDKREQIGCQGTQQFLAGESDECSGMSVNITHKPVKSAAAVCARQKEKLGFTGDFPTNDFPTNEHARNIEKEQKTREKSLGRQKSISDGFTRVVLSDCSLMSKFSGTKQRVDTTLSNTNDDNVLQSPEKKAISAEMRVQTTDLSNTSGIEMDSELIPQNNSVSDNTTCIENPIPLSISGAHIPNRKSVEVQTDSMTQASAEISKPLAINVETHCPKSPDSSTSPNATSSVIGRKRKSPFSTFARKYRSPSRNTRLIKVLVNSNKTDVAVGDKAATVFKDPYLFSTEDNKMDITQATSITSEEFEKRNALSYLEEYVKLVNPDKRRHAVANSNISHVSKACTSKQMSQHSLPNKTSISKISSISAKTRDGTISKLANDKTKPLSTSFIPLKSIVTANAVLKAKVDKETSIKSISRKYLKIHSLCSSDSEFKSNSPNKSDTVVGEGKSIKDNASVVSSTSSQETEEATEKRIPPLKLKIPSPRIDRKAVKKRSFSTSTNVAKESEKKQPRIFLRISKASIPSLSRSISLDSNSTRQIEDQTERNNDGGHSPINHSDVKVASTLRKDKVLTSFEATLFSTDDKPSNMTQSSTQKRRNRDFRKHSKSFTYGAKHRCNISSERRRLEEKTTTSSFSFSESSSNQTPPNVSSAFSGSSAVKGCKRNRDSIVCTSNNTCPSGLQTPHDTTNPKIGSYFRSDSNMADKLLALENDLKITVPQSGLELLSRASEKFSPIPEITYTDFDKCKQEQRNSNTESTVVKDISENRLYKHQDVTASVRCSKSETQPFATSVSTSVSSTYSPSSSQQHISPSPQYTCRKDVPNRNSIQCISVKEKLEKDSKHHTTQDLNILSASSNSISEALTNSLMSYAYGTKPQPFNVPFVTFGGVYLDAGRFLPPHIVYQDLVYPVSGVVMIDRKLKQAVPIPLLPGGRYNPTHNSQTRLIPSPQSTVSKPTSSTSNDTGSISPVCETKPKPAINTIRTTEYATANSSLSVKPDTSICIKTELATLYKPDLSYLRRTQSLPLPNKHEKCSQNFAADLLTPTEDKQFELKQESVFDSMSTINRSKTVVQNIATNVNTAQASLTDVKEFKPTVLNIPTPPCRVPVTLGTLTEVKPTTVLNSSTDAVLRYHPAFSKPVFTGPPLNTVSKNQYKILNETESLKKNIK